MEKRQLMGVCEGCKSARRKEDCVALMEIREIEQRFSGTKKAMKIVVTKCHWRKAEKR